jgi:NADH-quinone oxidoreductase subunit N
MILAATTIPIHVTASDWGAVLPELIMTSGVLTLLLLDAFLKSRRVEITTGVSLVAIVAAFASSAYLWTHGQSFAFYGTVTSDKFAMFFDYTILLSAALAVLLSPSYIERSSLDAGEYYALLLASCAGMMLMAAGTSFMTLFLAVELLSLALYILAGFERTRERSQEAGFKYFLLSSFATAFLIYGMALIYGATGSTQIRVIDFCLHGVVVCTAAAASSPLLFVGIGLMVVGFAFKVSVVPFHMWTPDVYEGAPTPITAFMSVSTKAAVFAAFVRVFNFSLSAVESHWFGLIWALAIATMITGNLIALVQTNMKRLLAYSGIAHAGYVLVAMAANNPDGVTAVAFYFLAYAFMNIGAFILVSVLESRGVAGDDIASYRGLWFRNPALAGTTAVFMFSLAGFPPTAGFFAKYLAFAAVVRGGHTELAIIGVITSLISIVYYLRVVALMFMTPEEEGAPEAPISAPADLAMVVAVAGTVGLGLLPTGFFNLATQSVDALRAVFG